MEHSVCHQCLLATVCLSRDLNSWNPAPVISQPPSAESAQSVESSWYPEAAQGIPVLSAAMITPFHTFWQPRQQQSAKSSLCDVDETQTPQSCDTSRNKNTCERFPSQIASGLNFLF